MNHSSFKEIYDFEPYSFQQYRERLAGVDPSIYIFRDKGRIIADAIAFRVDDEFYLWMLAVDPDYRREGLAGELLQKVEEDAYQRGIYSVVAKVYGVSVGMQKLLHRKEYAVIDRVDSAKCSDHVELHFRKVIS